MKLTTANSKKANYSETHEIFIGAHTGSFKRLDVSAENPYTQTNLQDIKKLTKDSKITALNYGCKEKTEILIGRLNNFVQVFDTNSNEYLCSIDLKEGPVVGVCRYQGKLVAGLGTGKVHIQTDPEPTVLAAGDNMSRMRQCEFDEKLIATGGKERQNNLKIFDLDSMKQTFSSKNLANDFLNLEVPTWDSDVGFLDANRVSTCSRYGYVRSYDTRAQRRPVHVYHQENQFSFSCMTVKDPYVYVGTTMGLIKAFDTRNLKNFIHTYKGFTGSVSDLDLDSTGKFIVSGSLDRYVRVHDSNSCVLLYQCYVKSKPTRVLLRQLNVAKDLPVEDDCVLVSVDEEDKKKDEEYEALFASMPTISETKTDKGDTKKANRKRKRHNPIENSTQKFR